VWLLYVPHAVALMMPAFCMLSMFMSHTSPPQNKQKLCP